MRNILVVGATGPQARPVADKLAKDGFKVRALVRDKAKADDLAAAGVELAVGTLEDRASLAAATQGQDGVFLLISYISGTADQAFAVLAGTRSLGDAAFVEVAILVVERQVAVEPDGPEVREVLDLVRRVEPHRDRWERQQEDGA